MTTPAAPPHRSARRRVHRPAWAGRNYTLLTAAAVVANLGSHGALIAAAFAVLQAGGDGGDVGLVAAARTLPLTFPRGSRAGGCSPICATAGAR